jgi:hypothetical protein
MPDILAEIWGIQHLAWLATMNIANIRDAKSEFGLVERGIDVVFEFNGKRLGAQHTIFHFDEGQVPGKRGSPARSEEEATARATQTAFGMYASPDYLPALKLRVDEKIAIAARHDNRNLVAETWLVVSANLNIWGAAGSTMIVSANVCVEELNNLCHSQLTRSKFDRAYLVLHMNSIVYGWDRANGWCLVADTQVREREEHRERMNNLIFNLIPQHHRGV